MNEPCCEHAGNADRLVFVTRAAAGADCTDDVVFGILDHNGISDLNVRDLQTLAKALQGKSSVCPSGIHRVEQAVIGSAPWVLNTSGTTDLIRRIEADYPALEQVGAKVGIGVATGADKAYIGKYSELDVEADRKLPLAMTRDILSGHVEWRGYGVLNPIEDDGSKGSRQGFLAIALPQSRSRSSQAMPMREHAAQ